ncbi:MAG: hypothetical protein E7408_06085 [Ruminococcaceae bacterium]|nr:hypothetical protein [Oscillospiraceae bacterium]
MQYTGDKMLKKVLVILVTLLLLLPHVAAEEVNPELVTNGGFETVVSGNPTGNWSGTQIDWGEKVSVAVTSENVNSGKNAVKIVNDGTKSPWINIQVPNLIPGATYEVSFWLYAELKTAPQIPVGMSMEFYRGASTNSGGVGSNYVTYPGSTNGKWTMVSEKFKLPYEATMVKMYCRLWAEGYAYFDDVSLKLSETEKFNFTSSHIFHYTEETTATAYANINSFFLDSALEATLRANFYIYDGDTVVDKKLGVTFQNGSASYTYSIPDVLKKKGYAYQLHIDAVDLNGNILDSFDQNLYKYDRPRYIDENGLYHDENGKEVIPVIAYHLNTEDFPLAKEAGFTMFQVDYGCAPVERKAHRENVLNQAAENGLKGVFCLYYNMLNAAHPDIIGNTKKLVEQYKDDPRIFGWLVQDEPLGAGITEEATDLLELAYKTIRDIDPNHPIVIADYSSYVFKESVKYCDVFIPNSYSMDYSGVRAYVEESVKYANGRPVYPNVGAYARGSGTAAELPSGVLLQHFIYQAFMGGAKGVSMYSFSDVVRNPSKVPIYNTVLWEPLCTVLNNELPTFYDLFIHAGEAEKTETSSYAIRKWAREDGDYYLITSLSDAVQSITIPVGKERGFALLGGATTNNLTLGTDSLTASLAGGEVTMFKVFDAANTVQILKNGFSVSKLEVGWTTAKAPEAAERIYACFYKEVNGEKRLVRMVSGSGSTLSIPVFDTDLGYTLKVYAWDAAMRPVGKPGII